MDKNTSSIRSDQVTIIGIYSETLEARILPFEKTYLFVYVN